MSNNIYLLLMIVIHLIIGYGHGQRADRLFAYVDSDVTLPCGVIQEGKRIQLRWYKEKGYRNTELLYDVYNGNHRYVDSKYNISDTGNDLTIHNVTLADEAKYRCSVTDEVGIGERTLTLLLLDNGGEVRMNATYANESSHSMVPLENADKLPPGSKLKLQVEAENYRGVEKIVWRKNGLLLKEDFTKDIITSRKRRHARYLKYSTIRSDLELTVSQSYDEEEISAAVIGLDEHKWAETHVRLAVQSSRAGTKTANCDVTPKQEKHTRAGEVTDTSKGEMLIMIYVLVITNILIVLLLLIVAVLMFVYLRRHVNSPKHLKQDDSDVYQFMI